jgi:hypothetical protein
VSLRRHTHTWQGRRGGRGEDYGGRRRGVAAAQAGLKARLVEDVEQEAIVRRERVHGPMPEPIHVLLLLDAGDLYIYIYIAHARHTHALCSAVSQKQKQKQSKQLDTSKVAMASISAYLPMRVWKSVSAEPVQASSPTSWTRAR